MLNKESVISNYSYLLEINKSEANRYQFDLKKLIAFHHNRDHRASLGESRWNKWLINPMTDQIMCLEDANQVIRAALKNKISIYHLRQEAFLTDDKLIKGLDCSQPSQKWQELLKQAEERYLSGPSWGWPGYVRGEFEMNLTGLYNVRGQLIDFSGKDEIKINDIFRNLKKLSDILKQSNTKWLIQEILDNKEVILKLREQLLSIFNTAEIIDNLAAHVAKYAMHEMLLSLGKIDPINKIDPYTDEKINICNPNIYLSSGHQVSSEMFVAHHNNREPRESLGETSEQKWLLNPITNQKLNYIEVEHVTRRVKNNGLALHHLQVYPLLENYQKERAYFCPDIYTIKNDQLKEFAANTSTQEVTEGDNNNNNFKESAKVLIKNNFLTNNQSVAIDKSEVTDPLKNIKPFCI